MQDDIKREWQENWYIPKAIPRNFDNTPDISARDLSAEYSKNKSSNKKTSSTNKKLQYDPTSPYVTDFKTKLSEKENELETFENTIITKK